MNLASRLADKAEPGQILVTERTMVAVDHIVDGRQVDEISLKGISRPIKIYEIVPRDGEHRKRRLLGLAGGARSRRRVLAGVLELVRRASHRSSRSRGVTRRLLARPARRDDPRGTGCGCRSR